MLTLDGHQVIDFVLLLLYLPVLFIGSKKGRQYGAVQPPQAYSQVDGLGQIPESL